MTKPITFSEKAVLIAIRDSKGLKVETISSTPHGKLLLKSIASNEPINMMNLPSFNNLAINGHAVKDNMRDMFTVLGALDSIRNTSLISKNDPEVLSVKNKDKFSNLMSGLLKQ